MQEYYLDNMAATPLCEDAANIITRLAEKFGNPSSVHPRGREMRKYISTARKWIAKCIGAKPEEIIFTSGATEAVNLAAHYFRQGEGKAVIADSSSHDCVYNIADVYFDTNAGDLRCEVRNKFQSMSCWGYTQNLLCMTLLNNETGASTNPQLLADIAHHHGSYLLCDATAAIGHYPINVNDCGVDYLCASGEKIGALSGVGFLYVRTGAPLLPLCNGGQENGRRGGTENVIGIASLGEAIRSINYDARISYTRRNQRYNNTLTECFKANQLEFEVVSAPESALNGIYNVAFRGVRADALAYLLETQGIYVSAGSACHAGSNEPSRVLMNAGVPPDYIYGAIRLSFGKTDVPIEYIAEQIVNCVKQLNEV